MDAAPPRPDRDEPMGETNATQVKQHGASVVADCAVHERRAGQPYIATACQCSVTVDVMGCHHEPKRSGCKGLSKNERISLRKDKDFFQWKTRFFVASFYEAPSLLRMTSFHHYHLDSVLGIKLE